MKPSFLTPIAVRAYSERSGRKPLGSRLPTADSGASEWTLVFDCETTVDAAQTLRFGSFQVRNVDGGQEARDSGVERGFGVLNTAS